MKLIIPPLIAAAVIGGATFVTTTAAFAEVGGNKPTETQHAEKAQERKLKMGESLSIAVTNDTLTMEQKTLLEEKIASVDDKQKALHDSGTTRDEMRVAMNETRDELKAWAEENDISLRDILPVHAQRGGHEERAQTDEE